MEPLYKAIFRKVINPDGDDDISFTPVLRGVATPVDDRGFKNTFQAWLKPGLVQNIIFYIYNMF